jgi:NAD(P)-dependent dehydrogenase (short-subunit alcohol dehydrogenase family)
MRIAVHKQSIEDFDKILSVNARGLFLCMKYEIQQMLTQGSGAIVNNSSTNGLVALPGISGSIFNVERSRDVKVKRSQSLNISWKYRNPRVLRSQKN